MHSHLNCFYGRTLQTTKRTDPAKRSFSKHYHLRLSIYQMFVVCQSKLPDDEFRLYQRLFDIIHQQLIQPDLLIYLHAPVSGYKRI